MKLLLLLLVGALATETQFITEQLRMKLPQNEYNAQIVDMLELSLQQGGKIDSVISLLQKMLDDLNGEQTVSNQEHSQRITQYTNNIENLENNLASLQSEVQTNNQQLTELSSQISSLTQSSVSLKKQLNNVNSREETIRASRQQEIELKQKRQAAGDKILAAIQLIHDKLVQTVLNEQGSFLEVEDKKILTQQLKDELGERHPIALMVALTTEFDQETAKKVIQKLEDIIESIKDSEGKSAENETQANANYQAILRELTSIRDKLAQESQKTDSLLKTKQNDFVIAKRRSGQLVKDQDNTELLLQTNRVQKDQYDANYNSNTQKRESQVGTLKQAHQLLVENADKLRK
ncbi:hypothetical protein pb186bvf_009653 [Paramecium bursaria]